MWPNPQVPEDLITFTEETLNGKLIFLCSVFHRNHVYWDVVSTAEELPSSSYPSRLPSKVPRRAF